MVQTNSLQLSLGEKVVDLNDHYSSWGFTLLLQTGMFVYCRDSIGT